MSPELININAFIGKRVRLDVGFKSPYCRFASTVAKVVGILHLDQGEYFVKSADGSVAAFQSNQVTYVNPSGDHICIIHRII